MDFSAGFKSFSEVSTPAEGSYLKPWNIYKGVKFGGVSDPSTGNKKDGGTWKAWDFTFECEDGVYRERIFEPTTLERGKYNDKELPSDFERSQCFIAQVMSVYNPTGFEKLKALTNEGKIKTFDQFIEVVKKLLAKPVQPTADNDIQLKLCGRKTQDGKVYARLTNCAIGQDGKPFMSAFLGKKLSFSAWEEGEKKKYESASPSDPEASKPITTDIDTSPTSGDDDIDFDKELGIN